MIFKRAAVFMLIFFVMAPERGFSAPKKQGTRIKRERGK